MLFNIQRTRERREGSDAREQRVGVTNAEGPPVPIPNTEVKLRSGEDTIRATVWENSSMPTRKTGGVILRTFGPKKHPTGV